ncbi:MAG TPA: UbiX family flavin prenyltransferase [Thermoanaerobaculia bacterium]|nr:UbiX family flavin prenyltransferase [Thermoanaerobaculia bacterium]
MSSRQRTGRVVAGITGASGVSLAVHFLRAAASHQEIERIHLIVSQNGLRVAASELDPPAGHPSSIVDHARLTAADASKIEIHPDSDIGATIASGSYPTDGMVIVPCSSGTLGSIAHGISRGLIQRAADLTLKERRPLILALRETPLSLIHAENIAAVTRAGAIVAPPIPAFYIGETWQEYLDHFALRLLDLLGYVTDRPELRWDGGKKPVRAGTSD